MMNREQMVVSIPHAGTLIPDDIRALIPHDELTVRNESDLFSDRIFTIDGARIVTTPYSRMISDPNRAPDEIYSEGMLRSLGVVMFDLHDGRPVFSKDPSLHTVSEWTHRFHVPYHNALAKVVKGAKFLIDGHTMWSKGVPGHFGGAGKERADIVLGNQYFCTCSAETTNFFASFFREKNYNVAINDPYPGRFILGTYCSRLYVPGIQIEINRKLFLDEKTLEPDEKSIQKLHAEFDELVTSFCGWFKGPMKPEEKAPVDLSRR